MRRDAARHVSMWNESYIRYCKWTWIIICCCRRIEICHHKNIEPKKFLLLGNLVFYDHIIRNHNELNRIVEYIKTILTIGKLIN